MLWKTGAIAFGAAITLGLSGCTTCHHRAAEWSLCSEASPETCSSQRSRVHLFLIGGLDVFDDGGLRGLRDAVNAAGFSQVYCGQSHHGGMFAREMRRIACDDPEARFVLVGYGTGAHRAVNLAAEACCDGNRIDGLVLLDPHPDVLTSAENSGIPVHVFGSDRWVPGLESTASEITKLPGVSHFALATHPCTIEQTVELLRNAVARVPDDAEPTFALPMIDNPAPIPAIIADRPGTRSKAPAGKLTSRPPTGK